MERFFSHLTLPMIFFDIVDPFSLSKDQLIYVDGIAYRLYYSVLLCYSFVSQKRDMSYY